MIIHTTGNDRNRGRNAAFSKKLLTHSSRECPVRDTSFEELCERFVGVVLTTGITSIGYGNDNERILFGWIFRSPGQSNFSNSRKNYLRQTNKNDSEKVRAVMQAAESLKKF